MGEIVVSKLGRKEKTKRKKVQMVIIFRMLSFPVLDNKKHSFKLGFGE